MNRRRFFAALAAAPSALCAPASVTQTVVLPFGKPRIAGTIIWQMSLRDIGQPPDRHATTITAVSEHVGIVSLQR